MSHEQSMSPQAEPAASAEAQTVGSAADGVAAVVSGEPAHTVAEADEYIPTESRSEVEVGIVRSVRIGPILIGAMILGAAITAVVSLFFPVAQDATYTLAQATGFASLVGAVIGLFLGAILVLILGKAAKRQSGAARAVLTDVR